MPAVWHETHVVVLRRLCSSGLGPENLTQMWAVPATAAARTCESCVACLAMAPGSRQVIFLYLFRSRELHPAMRPHPFAQQRMTLCQRTPTHPHAYPRTQPKWRTKDARRHSYPEPFQPKFLKACGPRLVGQTLSPGRGSLAHFHSGRASSVRLWPECECGAARRVSPPWSPLDLGCHWWGVLAARCHDTALALQAKMCCRLQRLSCQGCRRIPHQNAQQRKRRRTWCAG